MELVFGETAVAVDELAVNLLPVVGQQKAHTKLEVF